MDTEAHSQVTQLLGRVKAGDESARDELFATVYDELRRIAAALMRDQRSGHTLQPTALVNEAAMRLLRDKDLGDNASRTLFFWTAVRAMRRVLVDHARKTQAQRRGGEMQKAPLEAVIDLIQAEHNVDLVALDEALEHLQAVNERQSAVVMLRFFGGLSLSEIAEQQGVSLSTVEKDWRIARAWLRRQLDAN